MEDKKFKPYVPADKVMPEFTITSIILGSFLAVVFGAANAYLGLRVGMTVSASIPAAVISMALYRFFLHRDSILENNMVQTIGSAGESVAAGAIFTLPALFMWAKEGLTNYPSVIEMAIIAACGGVLGVLLMIPLRNALIVQEHGTLAYPEGRACAEVLIAGEEGGSKASVVFSGLGIAAIYKFLVDGLKIFPNELHWDIPGYRGAAFGADILPALAGVGYICGTRVSSYLFAGGTLAWFVIIPLIALFGSDVVIYPAQATVAQLWTNGGTWALWKNFVRYIGAGAVAAGGIMSLMKSLPLIIRTFKEAMQSYSKGKDTGKHTIPRTELDIPMNILLLGVLLIAILMWVLPLIPVNFISAVIIVVFGFFFATVSSRMVGMIGSSNNPVSGMTIATLLIATLILKATGNTGAAGMIGAITIGSVICIIAAIAGDVSQDLKCGFLVGATPKKQQLGEIIGVLVSAVAIGGILYLLDNGAGFGSKDLAAPQATLMKLVVEGVMGGNLPWALVLTGVFIAVVIEILGIPVLPVAIGLYLPIHLSTPIMLGGLIRLLVEKRKAASEQEHEAMVQSGVLYSSGLIAGEGFIGILLAVFAVIPMNNHTYDTFADFINLQKRGINFGTLGGVIFFALLLLTLLKATIWNKNSKEKE